MEKRYWNHSDSLSGVKVSDGGHVLAMVTFHTSKPMRNIFARAGKCAPGDDKGTIIRTPRTHGVVGVSAHHGAVKIVGIVFGPIPWVNDVGIGCAVSESRSRESSAKRLGDTLCHENDTHPAPFRII
jgi:hypothetical protein